ncbi:hypothetical protein [Actinokineospora sp. NBRC 105648]|uniref:hypothetical protein n=1 Tax=Actinokineospora sp. NBRC 105648 TaxID=3032206 RepID=UPI0024A1376A|nr:hypothetical protein [Actinokineospora sp. NBRC 105648]GLZ43589.1 hypothetical protein Acsp05_72130 [Actinokineospora sp. NBRC 105648]
MSPPAAWACSECDANNGAAAKVCRICHAPKATAASAVPEPTAVVPKVTSTGERPDFVESKHAARAPAPRSSGSRIRLTGKPRPRIDPVVPPPAPERWTRPSSRSTSDYRPPEAPAEPPRRASYAAASIDPPAPHLARRGFPRAGHVVRRTLLALVVLGVWSNWDSILDALPDAGQGSGDNQAVAAPLSGTPCPTEAAQWISGASVLEGSYTTSRHVITLCRDAAGQLHYDGQLIGRAPSADSHISIPAESTATGYTARNKTYLYVITGGEVIVFNNGTELSRQTLTRTGP